MAPTDIRETNRCFGQFYSAALQRSLPFRYLLPRFKNLFSTGISTKLGEITGSVMSNVVTTNKLILILWQADPLI